MPNIKKHTIPWSETGKTVYTIVRREVDLYRLNDADGTFAAAPADLYLSLAEDAIIKGLYEVSESRTAWNDGNYLFLDYRQTGGTEVPANDMMIGWELKTILNDAEVTNVNVLTQSDIDFGALQKASLNAATPAVTVSDKTGFSLSATGADLILSTATFAVALATAVSNLATYGLAALNTLLVTTGIKAASVPALVQADVRTAVGLASANLDTQFVALPTDADVNAACDTAISDAALATAANLATIAGYLDTEIAAIKAKTDTIGGAGAITWPYTLTDVTTGVPIDGAEVWVTTDSAGANIIATGTTDAAGVVTFYLDAGTVYIWRKKAGFTFVQPDQETVA